MKFSAVLRPIGNFKLAPETNFGFVPDKEEPQSWLIWFLSEYSKGNARPESLGSGGGLTLDCSSSCLGQTSLAAGCRHLQVALSGAEVRTVVYCVVT